MAAPFLTILTRTYRRPAALAACLASVGRQTRAAAVDHIVLVDHVGVGIAATHARFVQVRAAARGRYVLALDDDNVLASETVIGDLERFAMGDPPLLLPAVQKGELVIPGAWPPICGLIDMGNLVVRADIWRAHADAYGPRYEGDFDFASALAQAGIAATRVPLLLLRGPVNHGRPE